MNQKKSKKIRQYFRRDVKAQLTEFESYLKPKPKYVPQRVWLWMVGKVIDLGRIKK